MPLPIAMAHRLARRLADVRKAGRRSLPASGRQGQVTIAYEDGRPVRVDTVLISAQHREEVDVETLLKPDVEAEVVEPVLREFPEIDAPRRAGHREPDGAVRDRRAEGRHGPHRPQDHRRHVRRHGAARRRRLLREGPDQGRPLRGVHGAVRREERRGLRPRRPLPAPGGVRDRHRPPRFPDGRHVRHGAGRSRKRSRKRSATCSTSGRPRSSATWISPVRSTARRPRTGISGAKSSPGRRPTASTTSAAPPLGEPAGPRPRRPRRRLHRPPDPLPRPPVHVPAPGELEAGVGSLVQVPFHGRLIRGWVLGPADELRSADAQGEEGRVSPVRFFDEAMLELLRWVSERYVAPLAAVIGVRVAAPGRVRRERRSGLTRDRGAAPAARRRRPSGPARGLSARAGPSSLDAGSAGSASGRRVRPSAGAGGRGGRRRRGRRCVSRPAGGARSCWCPRRHRFPRPPRRSSTAFGERVGLFVGGDKRARYRTWLEIRDGRYDVVVGTRPACSRRSGTSA